MPRELSNLQIWWHGPSWLKRDREGWPQACPTMPIENLPERKIKTIAAVVTRIQDQIFLTNIRRSQNSSELFPTCFVL